MNNPQHEEARPCQTSPQLLVDVLRLLLELLRLCCPTHQLDCPGLTVVDKDVHVPVGVVRDQVVGKRLKGDPTPIGGEAGRGTGAVAGKSIRRSAQKRERSCLLVAEKDLLAPFAVVAGKWTVRRSKDG